MFLKKVLIFGTFFVSLAPLITSQFKAAVVEYYAVHEADLTPEQRLIKNAQNYVNILLKIKQDVDVVVFPESTLTTNVSWTSRDDVLPYAVELPEISNDVSLCESEITSLFLYYLACSTKTVNSYLVVNLIEKARCTETEDKKCAPNGWDFYNTNIVLNRNRALVAKYRKYNLFGEYYLNQTTTPDVTIFEMDSKIKFGVFTCFDILFRKPALELIRENKIRHIIYPTMWFSELPFLTALQAQQQWAHETDAVLLASGANNPKVGSGGSGIFNGKLGPTVYDILDEKSKVFISEIPLNGLTSPPEKDLNIDETAKALDNFYLKKDDLKSYAFLPISNKKDQMQQKLCSGEGNNRLCCNFDITMEWSNDILEDNKNHYQYLLVAHSGVRSFSGVYNGGVEICGIVACTQGTPGSCGERFKDYSTVSWPVKFTKISITADFKEDANRIQFPNSLLSNLRPLPVSSTEWITEKPSENVVKRTHILKQPENRLMTFAIYGRDFNRDSEPSTDDNDNTDGSCSKITLSLFTVILLTLLTRYLNTM